MPYDMKRIPKHPDPAPGEAVRIGDELREAREALGLTVPDMATRLRIRRAYLEALEEGRLSDLPGIAYAVGFVRSYATALGLGGDEMARRFRDSTLRVAEKPKLVFPEPVAERGVPAGAVMVAGMALMVGAYVAWFNLSGGGQRTVDVVPPVPPRLEQAAEQGRSQLPQIATAPRAADPGTLPVAALPPPGGIGQAGSSTSAQAATVPAAPPPAPVATPTPPPVVPPAAAAAIPGAPEGTRVVLRARPNSGDGAWVQVRDARAGAVVVSRVLRPGEAWPAPVREGLVLDTGKADGLEILVDGQPQPTLDGLIGVRRNIALDPDRLRQRLVQATASAASAATPASAQRSQ